MSIIKGGTEIILVCDTCKKEQPFKNRMCLDNWLSIMPWRSFVELEKTTHQCVKCYTLQLEKGAHHLKIMPEYLDAILDGSKTFEIRKNDRGYAVGDVLLLKDGSRQGRVKIMHMTDYEQKEGFVVLGIKIV